MSRGALFFILLGILTHTPVPAQNPAGGGEVYLVLLREPSVVEMAVERSSGSSQVHRRQVLASQEARRHQEQIEDQQLSLLDRLGVTPPVGGQLEVLDRRSYLLNLLVVRTSPEQLDELRKDDRVESVSPNRVYYPTLDSAPDLLDAPLLWEALGGSAQAGLGMKIGIIDSGIDTSHPMFGGNGLVAPAGFPRGVLDFTTSKVIVARNYVLPDFGLRDQSIKTPIDELGHGSRVAGVAAGGRVETSVGTIQGFAPAAFLGNYKVFGSPTLNPTTTSAAIIAALEDGVQDGMDVLNLSLGGPAKTFAEDPEQQAIRMAVAAGVVVVVAAGNAGPDPGTVLSPGTSPDVITVGATSNGRIFASGLIITSEAPLPPDLSSLPYVAGSGQPITQTVGPLPMVSVVSLDPSELACSPFPPQSFTEQVVLVRRGDCFFSTKAEHVFGAGAAGMVVYNNVEGNAVVMSGLGGILEPAVMIEKGPGEKLRDFLQLAAAEVTFGPESEETPFPTEPHLVSEFSGRGPTEERAIKPDLVAPGESIHTANHELEAGFPFTKRASGTSFATPMVAAGAALIKQLHPQWTEQLSASQLARAIKSVVVNSAAKEPRWRGRPAGIMQGGNGRLDLGQAMHNRAALHPVSFSFGHVQEDASGRLEQRVELTNLDFQQRTFQLEVEAQLTNPTVEVFTSPPELTLAAGETGEFVVNVDLLAPLTGGVFEGFVQVNGSSGGTQLEAAYWGAVTVEDDSVTLNVSQNDVAAHPSLAAAVEAAQPGNVILIQDDGVYEEVVDLRFNRDGLLLHGLKIEGEQGLYPTLDVGNLPGNATVVTVSDLERVTIQGLRLQGGRQGILYRNSSGVIRGNIVEGSSGSQGSHGIEVSQSQVHLYGNQIFGSRGRGLALFGSDALIQHNHFGGQEPGQENRGGGIYAPGGGQLGIFANRVVGNGGSGFSDAGIYLSSLDAIVKGNQVEQGRSDSAGGVTIRGPNSRVTLLDNEIRGNGGDGVSVEGGVQAVLRRNLIEGNEGAGIRLESGARAEVISSRLLDNQSGIRSLLSEVILSDSLVAHSRHPLLGDGIYASAGELQVSNSTIFGNAGWGISSSGQASTVVNTIVEANSQGDLQGVPGELVTNSLISDGTLQEMNGNLSGPALFIDPDANDFSLRLDSPAIDRGSLEPTSSDLDLRSHLRVVDGNQDGLERVDMGAIEFDSSYWTPLLVTVVTSQEDWFHGLGVVNASAHTAKVLIRGYATDGELTTSMELPPLESGEQRHLLLEEIPGLPRPGWLELLSTRNDLIGVSFVGDYQLNSMAGGELCCALSDELVFAESSVDHQRSDLFLVNPGRTAVEVVLTRAGDGQDPLQASRWLPPKGMLVTTVEEVFGNASAGYVMASVPNGEGIFGMQVVGDDNSSGALLALPAGAGASELLAPHFNSGSVIQTVLRLIATETASQIRIEAIDSRGGIIDVMERAKLDDGEEWVAPVNELFILPAGSVSGWLRISAQQGKLLGTIRFSEAGVGMQAVALLVNQGAREQVFAHAHQEAGIFSALAILNPFPTEALVSIEILDEGGRRGGVALMNLGAGHRQVGLLADLIAEPFPATGWIRIRSNSPVVGLEVVGGDGFFSAIGQQVAVP